ncbi:MAG TPA: hypothetical protein DIW43_13970, partial [Spongiibacteraceae bacterium]|nr:hypothetical protein [Spongiibacteraceae bacterium]
KSGGELVAALRRRARESGVLTLVAGEHGEVLRLLPALTISEPLLKDGLQRIGDCLQMLLQEESVVCRA